MIPSINPYTLEIIKDYKYNLNKEIEIILVSSKIALTSLKFKEIPARNFLIGVIQKPQVIVENCLEMVFGNSFIIK